MTMGEEIERLNNLVQTQGHTMADERLVAEARECGPYTASNGLLSVKIAPTDLVHRLADEIEQLRVLVEYYRTDYEFELRRAYVAKLRRQNAQLTADRDHWRNQMDGVAELIAEDAQKIVSRDIEIERLRAPGDVCRPCLDRLDKIEQLTEHVAEVERLNNLVHDANTRCVHAQLDVEAKDAEVERLRAALTRISKGTMTTNFSGELVDVGLPMPRDGLREIAKEALNDKETQ